MSASLLLSILQYEAEASDLQSQILKETMSKNLKHKQSSAVISQIRNRYSSEKEKIRNQIKSLDTSSASEEYSKLMAELNEIRDNEERDITQEEEAATEYENTIQLHIDNDQTRLEAINADLEQFKETNQENVKEEFGYFQK